MIAAQLAELIGTEQVSADAEILAAHRFDRWCLKHWQDWQGEALDAPACVVRPRDSQTFSQWSALPPSITFRSCPGVWAAGFVVASSRPLIKF